MSDIDPAAVMAKHKPYKGGPGAPYCVWCVSLDVRDDAELHRWPCEIYRLAEAARDLAEDLHKLRAHKISDRAMHDLHENAKAYSLAVQALNKVRGGQLSTTIAYLIEQGLLVPVEALKAEREALNVERVKVVDADKAFAAFRQAALERFGQIEEKIACALAEHDHADTCGFVLSPGSDYPCNCWRSTLTEPISGYKK